MRYLLSFFLTVASLSLAQPAPDLVLPDGYTAEVVVTGLQGPTQLILGPDGRLWTAQLAGGENANTGEVVAVSLETGEPETLLSELLKPTGLAVLDGYLWLAAGNTLVRAPLEGDKVGVPETVLSNLPFNGRSNGTLTVTPDGKLLYETSGRRQGNGAQPGSATLWALSPDAPTQPTPLATGFKGAYAHTYDAAGNLFSTDIGDDPVNGRPPPDELDLVTAGGDYGWPQCFGNLEAARNYGGTPEKCAATEAPLALFAPQSTPTSVVVSPFEGNVLLVALWGPANPRVVRVPYDPETLQASGEVTTFIEGLSLPQSLLALPDGGLLVSDFASGTVYRVARR
ncbi:hypothetical protein BH24DEI2_BH24DEI2_21150 [soil metagenome]